MMTNFKRLAAMTLAGAMTVGMMAGCGGSSGGEAPAGSAAGSGAAASSGKAASSTASSSEKPQASGKKALVVYYSDTGRTEQVAKDLAKAKDADLMKIEPAQKYTKDDLDYNNPDSRVSKEHDDDTLRDKITLKKTMPDNWA